MIAVDVATTGDPRRKENETYFIWTRGKAPDVVIEIVSDRRGGEETRKLEKYANWGVILYVIHDPAEKLRNGVLRAFGLIRGNYVPIDPKWFEAVELGLTLWKGTYEDRTDTWLRWCDSRGRVIPTGNERADREKSKAKKDRQRAEQERQRAEQERQRAEQERQRAEQERQRAERLKAQLRARGIEPDNGTNGR